MGEERWATFDCYGTLVDWNAGIRGQLARLFGGEAADGMLAEYHAIEPRVQAEQPGISYRAVMASVLAELASDWVPSFPTASATRWRSRFLIGPCSATFAAPWTRRAAGDGSCSCSRTATAS